MKTVLELATGSTGFWRTCIHLPLPLPGPMFVGWSGGTDGKNGMGTIFVGWDDSATPSNFEPSIHLRLWWRRDVEDGTLRERTTLLCYTGQLEGRLFGTGGGGWNRSLDVIGMDATRMRGPWKLASWGVCNACLCLHTYTVIALMRPT